MHFEYIWFIKSIYISVVKNYIIFIYIHTQYLYECINDNFPCFIRRKLRGLSNFIIPPFFLILSDFQAVFPKKIYMDTKTSTYIILQPHTRKLLHYCWSLLKAFYCGSGAILLRRQVCKSIADSHRHKYTSFLSFYLFNVILTKSYST